MKEICESCLHSEVCKLRDKYIAINKAVEDLLKTEEAKGREFAITVGCSKYYDKGNYLKR